MSLFKINSGESFFESLYSGITARYNIADLHNLEIYLPNQYSCYLLTQYFASNLTERQSLLLPKIRSLNNIQPIKNSKYEKFHILETSEEKIILNQFLSEFNALTDNSLHNDLLLNHLSLILKKFRINNVDLTQLNDLRTFSNNCTSGTYNHVYKLLSQKWDSYLSDHLLLDKYQYNNLITKEIIAQKESAKNIIIAGSTGSIYSTRSFMKYLLDNKGSVVIYNDLDHKSLSSWIDISQGHPNYCFKNLLNFLSWAPQDSELWSKENYIKFKTNYFIFQNQHKTEKLSETYIKKNTFIFELEDETQELIKICNLVANIHKQDINQKIAIIIKRDDDYRKFSDYFSLYGLNTKAVSSCKIKETAEFTILNELYQFLSGGLKILDFLSLSKNKFAFFNYSQKSFKKRLYDIEKKYFRKVSTSNFFDQFIYNIEDQLFKDSLFRLHKFVKYYKNAANYNQKIQAFINILSYITQNDNGISLFFHTKVGHITQKFLQNCLSNNLSMYSKSNNIIRDIIRHLGEQKIDDPNLNNDQNILIAKSSDIRLGDIDHVIIPQFDDSSWPSRINNKLSGNIKLEFVTDDLHESLEANDFIHLTKNKNIYFTRAIKTQTGFTNPSKWLKSYYLAEGEYNLSLLPSEVNNTTYNLVNLFTETRLEKKVNLPNPPITSRPSKLSVSDLETLMRDPYSFYAKKILKLKEIDSILQDPAHKDFGVILHRTIEMYETKGLNSKKDFLHQGKLSIEKLLGSNPLKYIWFNQIEKIADYYISLSNKHRSSGEIICETSGETSIKNITLHARADQVLIKKESACIIDFKTGLLPTKYEIDTGASPQMTGELIIAKNDGYSFKSIPLNAKYVRLSNSKQGSKEVSIKDIDKRISYGIEGLEKLFNHYFLSEHLFELCPDKSVYPSYSSYKHLSRIAD